MYNKYFQLNEKPFSMTPDPKFVFFSQKHREALAHLIYGIRERQGFIEITGEVGTGKTTLCRTLVNTLDKKTKLAMVFNSDLNDIDLLKTILEEFELSSEGREKKSLLDRLNQFLIEQLKLGNNVVLVIDEAQNLKSEVLEQVRMLSNIETEKDKLLQIVLVGQPELKEKLALPELRQLNQRITVRYHINALSEKETQEYISYRLSVAGDKTNVSFTKKAYKAAFKLTGGVPRLINVLCHHALLVGYTRRVYEITDKVINNAHEDFNDDAYSNIQKCDKVSLIKPLAMGVTVGSALFLFFALYSIFPMSNTYLNRVKTSLASTSDTLSHKVKRSISYRKKQETKREITQKPYKAFRNSPRISGSVLSKYFSLYGVSIPASLRNKNKVNIFMTAYRVGLAGELHSVKLSEIEHAATPSLLQVGSEGSYTLFYSQGGKHMIMDKTGISVFNRRKFKEIYSGNALFLRPIWLKINPANKGYQAAVMRIQKELWNLRYFNGVPGGFIGEKTKVAIKKFQEKNGLEQTGVLDIYTQSLFAGKLIKAS